MASVRRNLVDRIADSPAAAALPIQFRVIGALMMREAMSRFGRENIGFFWLMGEPLLLTLGVMAIWTFLKHNHGSTMIGVVPFVLTGYTMLTLWRHSTGRAVHAFRNNAGLLFHRRIYFTDIVLSRVLLDMVAIGTAFFVAYVPLYLFGAIDPIHDPLALIMAWMLLAFFCFGVALLIASLTEMVEPLEHFVQPVMYLMLPIGGTFFMVEWLPHKMQRLALTVPLVHFNEMFRYGLYGDKIVTHWSIPYMLVWCLGLTALGFLLAPIARTRIRFE
jgi:capsular polysaccharide transport system permease protein